MALPQHVGSASGLQLSGLADITSDHAPLLSEGKPAAKPFTKAQVKNLAVRKWISVNAQGETTVLEVDKLRVTHQLGVQLRDLRLLDPQLATSYPSAILCREKALVVNMEFIKCVITTSSVYVTNLDDDNTVIFVEELTKRLEAAHKAAASLAATAEGAGALGQGPEGLGTPAVNGGFAAAGGGPGSASGVGLDHVGMHAAEMPFELRALEVALDTVTGYLERLTGDLESAAHPALDALTARITTSNLERVRRIKNRMVRLTTRVETLREVLEKFLDDDSDMKDMNLTAKEQEEAEMLQRHSLRAASLAATPFDVPLPATGGLGELGALTPLTPHSARSSRSSSSSGSSSGLEDDEDVEAVEMLLEPYFMQLDNTFNKLSTLCEYVEDTEDFINIELDSHRNQLIRIDLILTTFSAACGLITAITGLFAMNVQLRPNAENPGPYSMFVTLSSTSGALALLVFVTVVTYCKWKRII